MSPRIVIAPDSFKGSLDAGAVAGAMRAGILRHLPQADVRCCPLADGGEGTLQVIQAATGAEVRHFVVDDLTGKPVQAAVLVHDQTMFIESARVVGLSLIADSLPEQRSSAGLGQLLRRGLDLGLRRFCIGLGGTGCNEGGLGLLAELGMRLLDASGRPLPPLLAGLSNAHRADFSALDPRLLQSELLVLSDVSAPLCGPEGASYLFGPQKGVSPAQLPEVDALMLRWACLATTLDGPRLANHPGAGAAGGLGFALLLLGGKLQSGGRYLARLLRLEEQIAAADWVLTGEGRSDCQTLTGKLPMVVAELARQHRVPATLLSGGVERDALPALQQWFAGCFSLTLGPANLQQCRQHAAGWLADMAEQLVRLRWPDG